MMLFLQFVGLHIYNFHVILLKGVFQDSMTHVTIQELFITFKKQKSRYFNIADNLCMEVTQFVDYYEWLHNYLALGSF